MSFIGFQNLLCTVGFVFQFANQTKKHNKQTLFMRCQTLSSEPLKHLIDYKCTVDRVYSFILAQCKMVI